MGFVTGSGTASPRRLPSLLCCFLLLPLLMEHGTSSRPHPASDTPHAPQYLQAPETRLEPLELLEHLQPLEHLEIPEQVAGPHAGPGTLRGGRGRELRSQRSGLPKIRISRQAKVVVVGAGAAGIHIAAMLAKRGLRSVQVLEATDHVGGKCETIWDSAGTPHDMGACYLHQLYPPLLQPLLDEYDPENKFVSVDFKQRPDSFWVTGEHVGLSDNSTARGISMDKWIVQLAARNAGFPAGGDPTVVGSVAMVVALLRYIVVHEAILGKYPYGIPPRPSLAQWHRIDMTTMQFLTKYRLLPMEGLLRWGLQAMGYGALESTPAFYLLWFFHPDWVRLLLQNTITKQAEILMPSRGYQEIWQRMADKHVADGSIKLTLNSPVVNISRTEQGVNITYNDTATNSLAWLSADLVVMAADMSRFSGIISDLSDQEQQLFSGYLRSVLAVTLYESLPSLPVERPTILWLYRIRPNETRDGKGVVGRMYVTRNEKNSLSRWRRTGPDGTQVYGNLTGLQNRTAFQYVDGTADADPGALMQTLLNDLALAQEQDVRIIAQRPWPYFPGFSVEALKKGNPWEILKIQGQRRTLWVGSSVTFESVLDVLIYNNRLLDRLVVT